MLTIERAISRRGCRVGHVSRFRVCRCFSDGVLQRQVLIAVVRRGSCQIDHWHLGAIKIIQGWQSRVHACIQAQLGLVSLLQSHPLVQRPGDLLPDDILQSSVDLPAAVPLNRTVMRGDVVEQEEEVQRNSDNQLQHLNNPDNQREKHAKEHEGPKVVIVSQDLNIAEKLVEARRVSIPRIPALREQIHLHDRIQSHSVNDLARSIGENRSHPG